MMTSVSPLNLLQVQDDNHGNVAQHVDFFLPNRGHKDADGEWRADPRICFRGVSQQSEDPFQA